MLLARHPKSVVVVLWVLLALYLVYYVSEFDYLTKRTDVDDAVDAAVVNLLNGTNPYKEPVVPRFKEMGHFALIGGGDGVETVWAYGGYNYLPLDLLTYMAAHICLSPIGPPFWFVLANIVFSFAALYMLNRILRVDWLYYVPLAGMLILYLSFTNTGLTLLLLVAAAYVRERAWSHHLILTMLLLGLASLTKIFAVIPLAALALYELQAGISARDGRKLVEVSVGLGVCACCAALAVLPFGLSAVLASTAFVYSGGEVREDMPTGGTLLSELIPGSEFYSVISVVSTLAALAVGLRLRSLNDRIVLGLIVLLLVSAKSASSPLLVAGLYLTLRIHETAGRLPPGCLNAKGIPGTPPALLLGKDEPRSAILSTRSNDAHSSCNMLDKS